MSLDLFLSAFALMLVFEGIGPLLFPNRWRSFILKLASEQPNNIRQIGLVLVIIGCILLFLNN